MKHNHIEKLLTTALLFAIAVPSSLAYPYNSGYDSYRGTSLSSSSPSATTLSGDVKLTQNNERITLSLRDSDVKQVLRMFADKAGKNIVFHSSVKGKVTLDLVDMPINDAFTLVMQVSNLNYYIQDNTLIVLDAATPENAAFSKQEMMLFPVKYVNASSVADFLNKNVFGIKKAGVSAVDAATFNPATNEVIVFGMPSDAAIVRQVIAQLDKEPSNRTFTVNHTTPAEMADMICNMLLPAYGAKASGDNDSSDSAKGPEPVPGVGTSITGGAASAEDSGDSEGGGVGQIKLGEGVVACTVKQGKKGSSFDAQNISIAYYPTRGTVMMIGGSDAQQNLVENFIRTNDIKQQQAYLEMSIVELSEDGSKEFQNNWNVQAGPWGITFNNGRTSGGRYGGYYEQVAPVTKGGWAPVKADEPNGEQKYWSANGYLNRNDLIGNRTYIQWQMNYLIENKKARILANPKILITNGQQSVIDLTEDYVEKVTSEFMSSAGGTGSNVGQVQKTYTIGDDKGIKITLVPFISPDGYVTMNIKPQYSTEAGTVYQTNEDGSKDIAATLLNRRNLDLKNVRIKDGETLIIGGMIRELEQKTVQKIPVLGDLPLVGAAFRSSSTSKVKNELVIMITPKIINDGDGTVADRL